MWKLPDGRVIRHPSNRMFQTIEMIPDGEGGQMEDKVNHPERYLLRWDDSALERYGIYRYREVGYDSKYYNSTGTSEEVDGVDLTVTHTIEPKMTPVNLAKAILKIVKASGMSMYRNAKEYYDDVTDPDSPLADDEDPYIVEFDTWKVDLRQAYVTFRDELLAIVQGPGTALEKYEALVAFTYSDRWPEAPVQED